MKNEMLEQLKEHFRITPREQVVEEWNNLKEWGRIEKKGNMEQKKVRITREEFGEAIEAIKLQSDRDNDFSEAMAVAFPEVSCSYMMRPDTNAMVEGMINLLSSLMGDVDGWVEWFVYECDLGSTDMEATMQDGYVIVPRTASDIYDVITYEPKEVENLTHGSVSVDPIKLADDIQAKVSITNPGLPYKTILLRSVNVAHKAGNSSATKILQRRYDVECAMS